MGPWQTAFKHFCRILDMVKSHSSRSTLLCLVRTPNCKDQGNLTPQRAIIEVWIRIYIQLYRTIGDLLWVENCIWVQIERERKNMLKIIAKYCSFSLGLGWIRLDVSSLLNPLIAQIQRNSLICFREKYSRKVDGRIQYLDAGRFLRKEEEKWTNYP